MMKSYEKETFHLSGPQYLTKIFDWRNASHRRSIAASLVKGVYILERDRQKKRQGSDALAPPWWESFHFDLIQILVDSKDQSFFGAIYQYKCPNDDYHSTTLSHNKNPPKYVIAFRGTIMKRRSAFQDLKLDLRVIMHRLHNTPRIHIGLQAVKNVVDLNQEAYNDIWLAGHSLGSTIALLIGRDMVKIGYNLETYLFNPPFASLIPIEKIINNNTLKLGIRCAHSIATAGLSFAANMVMSPASTNQPNDTFTKLCGWTPYLFVNQSDPICSDYFGYFEYLEKMIESGAHEIARVVMLNSLQSILESAIGKESEPSQNLPSAHMITNLSPRPYSHGLSQWWAPGLQCSHKRYKFW